MSEALAYNIAESLRLQELNRDGVERPWTFYVRQAEDRLWSYELYRVRPRGLVHFSRS